MNYTRVQIADLIIKKIEKEKLQLTTQFNQSKATIGYFYIDNLLPADLALTIFNSFPEIKDTVSKKNIRENKNVAYQMDNYSPILKEIIYAFQDVRLVDLVGDICNISNVSADESLYAGGLSLMEKDNFLNPHLDNSHDINRNRWRVLNLLYYVTPNWKNEFGGNLELWQKGVKEKQLTIDSKFNRLVVMATHNKSWHSVSKVLVNKTRCCVSNYYFSKKPLKQDDSFHVTSFRGRPTEKTKDLLLKIDTQLRMGLRKFFKKGIIENQHKYKKDD